MPKIDDNSILFFARNITWQVAQTNFPMAIKAKNISKRAGNGWAFRDIDLEARFGETLCIFGPSGAGKTMLLRILSGQDRADTGLLILDESITPGSAVFPETLLARPLGLFGRITRRLVPETAQNRVKRLKPVLENRGNRLVLLDEPLSGLDIFSKNEIAGQIRLAASQGAALIVTAADFYDVCLIADRISVISDGYLRQTGTPNEIYDTPESSFIASLCGPINLIEARRLTSSKADMPEFQTISGGHRLFTQKMDVRRLGAINRNIKLGIRPEQIALSFGAAFPEDNLLKGTIVNTRFFGPFTHVEMDCNGLILTASVPRLIGITAGDECMVGLPPDRIRVFAN